MHNGPKAKGTSHTALFSDGEVVWLQKTPEGWLHSERKDEIGVFHPPSTDEGTRGWQVWVSV